MYTIIILLNTLNEKFLLKSFFLINLSLTLRQCDLLFCFRTLNIIYRVIPVRYYLLILALFVAEVGQRRILAQTDLIHSGWSHSV